MTIAVDFDGVLHTYDRGWADGTIYGTWKPDALVSLYALLEREPVFVHTSRSPRDAARWIQMNSGCTIECTTRMSPWHPFPVRFWNTTGVLLVTRRKLPARAYVDDRAVLFTNWDDVFGQLVRE